MTDNELEQWRDGGYPDRAQFRAIIEAALSARAELRAMDKAFSAMEDRANTLSQKLRGARVEMAEEAARILLRDLVVFREIDAPMTRKEERMYYVQAIRDLAVRPE